MSLLTIQVAIDHGRVTALPPGRLPETGHGYLTVLSTPLPEPDDKVRYTIATGDDGLPVIRASGLITSERVQEIASFLP